MDVNEDAAWLPHGSKTVRLEPTLNKKDSHVNKLFFLDLLDNLPRLRLSDDQMKAIIWAMRECGTPAVPSFYALRKKQASLVADISNLQPRLHISALRNRFYMNHPIDLISLVSNPFEIQIWHTITNNTQRIGQIHLYANLSKYTLRSQRTCWKAGRLASSQKK